MSYREILEEIKPKKLEIEKVHKIAKNAIDCINDHAIEENINAHAILVGSVAKDTWLSGNADIDIFINFPLEVDESYLKEKGLYLGYECSEYLNGVAEEHYASHPYLTSHINGYDVDFVPCYKIDNSDELKSAVDRTLLHTKYIQKHLKEKQKDEVLLLKKFMSKVGTYGSEFKVGGFAGYLCEMLILRYNTFEEVLDSASNWKNKIKIDLEDYGTSNSFKDPLIAIDPTDKNRNVAAALKREKMAEFVIASRNFLNCEDSQKISYFHNIKREIDCKDIIKQFKARRTKTIALSFNIPDVPVDSLHPQLRKTEQSISEKLEDSEFSVFKSDYWTDEDKIAIFIFELNVYKQSNCVIHQGPKIWDKKASERFLKVHEETAYILNDTLVLNRKREFRTAKDFINHILSENNIHIIKVGKNLKDLILNSYELSSVKDLLKGKIKNSYFDKKRENNKKNDESNDNNQFLDFLNFLEDFLNPGQLLKR